MDCSEVLGLVEKWVDGEATPRERVVAEEHIVHCEPCRSHKEFLERVALVAQSVKFESPPESYWRALPQKVMERIDAESSRPAVASAGALRFVGLAATVVIAIATGIYVASRGALEYRPRSDTVSDSVGTVASEAEIAEKTEGSPKPASPPPMARDEPASVPETVAPLDQSTEEVSQIRSELAAEPSAVASAAAPETPAAARSLVAAEEGARGDTSVRKARDCDVLRDRLVDLDGADLAEGHYQLALCSLERYEVERTQELREVASADVESFLALEKETPRATRLREALTRAQ